MAMAHGYSRVSGKAAVVMVHVTVGTANAICGLMNAARDHVPIVLVAGRTPITETGHIASRNSHIHWGQEAFDQGGMVRELRQMGLRAARRPAGRGGGRSRARHRHERAARAGLSDAAARGAGRSGDSRHAALRARRPRRCRRTGAAAIAAAAEAIARAEFPLIVTSRRRPRSAGLRRARGTRRRVAHCRWSRACRTSSTCRPTTP